MKYHKIINSFTFLFVIVIIASLHIGGCNDNNNGDGEFGATPPATSECMNIASPCGSVQANGDTSVTCTLSSDTCGVDLMDVIDQLNDDFVIHEDSVMWIQAWSAFGANGGGPGSPVPGLGGTTGAAQFTSSVSDISTNYGTTQVYYFLASAVGNDGDHCGGEGSSASFITTQDISLTPSEMPDADKLLIVAGGPGGGGGSNGTFGCLPPDGGNGGNGGVVVNQMSDTNPQICSVSGSFGLLGGKGGSGQSCTASTQPNWLNATTVLWTMPTADAGMSGTNTCDAGGGGGGGGVFSGGGGNHGNDDTSSGGGGGGGSCTVPSTQTGGPTSIGIVSGQLEGVIKITFMLPPL